MNKHTVTIIKKEGGLNCIHHLVRSTLLWGPLYTTGISGMAYAITPAVSGNTLPYIDFLLNSLVVGPACAALSGFVRWSFSRRKPEGAVERRGPKVHHAAHGLRHYRRAARRKEAA